MNEKSLSVLLQAIFKDRGAYYSSSSQGDFMIVDIANLKLSAQRGLLGNVFPQLRAVCVNSVEDLTLVRLTYPEYTP